MRWRTRPPKTIAPLPRLIFRRLYFLGAIAQRFQELPVADIAL
ncbi:hypothetical protein [Nostoc edaphicum]|nr:hypothetical protein [Nostoc edaphicum]